MDAERTREVLAASGYAEPPRHLVDQQARAFVVEEQRRADPALADRTRNRLSELRQRAS
jgi:hypothetical protein